MKVLAIDTATERCSVALMIDGRVIEREVETPRGHAELVLPMVEDVLSEGAVALRELDGIAYGRGPGAFTGVRIAIGVVQGLAFGAQLPTVGISNLAAVARQVAKPGLRILVCMDARMNEVYWGVFDVGADGAPALSGAEHVGAAETVEVNDIDAAIGTGFRAYPALRTRFAGVPLHADALPHARDVALLAEPELEAGRGVPASAAMPVYLRDRVTFVKPA